MNQFVPFGSMPGVAMPGLSNGPLAPQLQAEFSAGVAVVENLKWLISTITTVVIYPLLVAIG